MALVSILKKISNNIDSIVQRLVFIAIVGMIISITLQILFRVFFDSLTWTEELSRYLLVWSTFLGATLAYKRGMHIAVTFCVDILPTTGQKIAKILNMVLSIVFFIVVVVFGYKYMAMQTYQVSAALRVPMKWVYIIIPLSFIIMIIHSITAILEEMFDVKEVTE